MVMMMVMMMMVVMLAIVMVMVMQPEWKPSGRMCLGFRNVGTRPSICNSFHCNHHHDLIVVITVIIWIVKTKETQGRNRRTVQQLHFTALHYSDEIEELCTMSHCRRTGWRYNFKIEQ